VVVNPLGKIHFEDGVNHLIADNILVPKGLLATEATPKSHDTRSIASDQVWIPRKFSATVVM